MRQAISVLACLALLAGCGGGEEKNSNPAPPTTSAPPPDHVSPVDTVARDEVVTEQSMVPEIAGLPVAPGQWVFREEPTGPAALYGQPNVGAALSIRCDRAEKRIVIRRSGVVGPDITILTDRGINLFEADKSVDGVRTTVARFPANFPWFQDVLANASGNMGVRVGGGQPLVVPSGGAPAQVVNNCPK